LAAGLRVMDESGKPQVILVVDDQDGNREVLRVYLTWSGHVVIEASNGLDAVNIANRDCPDLIIMDLGMPVMDGVEAVRRLREVSQTCKIPIVAYTAFDTADREKVLKMGFNDLLSKPLHFQKLDSMLNRFLGSTKSVS
jgi:CheY-like chemotaxis protein